MPDGHRVRFDWAKDGTYTAALDDVTEDVRGEITVAYGRDQNSSIAPLVTGRGGLSLANVKLPGALGYKYSPKNAAGPLFANLKPARPVLIDRVIGGTAYTIFTGHTDDAPINPDIDSRLVAFSLVDSLGDLKRKNITTTAYAGLRTGEIVDLILDAAGWTGGRDLDAGATTVPHWWADGTISAYDALQQMLTTEGWPALLTIGSTGEIIFRDRHHRLQRTASTTVQQTWRGYEGAPEPVMNKGFQYDGAWRNIVNDVAFKVDVRTPDGARSTVWSTTEAARIAASGTKAFFVHTSDGFRDAIAPVAGVDFQVLSGTVTNVTLSQTSGASTIITLTAGAGGAKIQGMALRAYNIPVRFASTVAASDAASVLAYESANIPAGSEPIWANRWDAQSLADLYVLQRKQPLSILTVTFVLTLENAATSGPLLLTRDLSDRVKVIEPVTAINGDYFIESITHTIRSKVEHVITFGLEEAPTAPTNPFILGSSTLGGSATLGY